MLAERDHNVGQMLDAVDRIGIAGDTIVIFTGDNRPEFVKPWDGWTGAWCHSRLQAVKWRNYKAHFYQQETMVSPPLKLVGEYEANAKKHPTIPIGTPDPYTPVVQK